MVQTTTEFRPELPYKCWTVEDYHQMITTGILTTDDRVELLSGQIVEIVPQEPPHASNVSSFNTDLVVRFASLALVRTQLPITISPNSEPEPDLALVRIDPQYYRERHPTPEDVFLLIEIADSTLKRDCIYKAQIYAEAGILEYWVVDVKQRQVIVYRQPQGNIYQSEQILSITDQIAPLAFPEVMINFKNVLV
ncbi:MAG: Uma2 family endonuclease [Microcoleaceae cyanobacterium]